MPKAKDKAREMRDLAIAAHTESSAALDALHRAERDMKRIADELGILPACLKPLRKAITEATIAHVQIGSLTNRFPT